MINKPITITGDHPFGGSPVQYTLPHPEGVYIFASDENPSYVVHIFLAVLSAIRGENVLPEPYDPSNQYLFSVKQEGMVQIAWRDGAYEVAEIGSPGFLEALQKSSSTPDEWVGDVMAAAYPKTLRTTGKIREVLDAATAGCAVALLNPEHSLHPGAVRALVNGLFELRYDNLILIETVSPSFLSDYARCSGRPPSPPMIFQTHVGMTSFQEIDAKRPHYLGHFDIGDLYHAEAMFDILPLRDKDRNP